MQYYMHSTFQVIAAVSSFLPIYLISAYVFFSVMEVIV